MDLPVATLLVVPLRVILITAGLQVTAVTVPLLDLQVMAVVDLLTYLQATAVVDFLMGRQVTAGMILRMDLQVVAETHTLGGITTVDLRTEEDSTETSLLLLLRLSILSHCQQTTLTETR